MAVLRIPIIEGSCPDSIEDVEHILDGVESIVESGANVLCHCRGGVGRAGLIACCFLLRRRYIVSADRAIQYVRIRRVSLLLARRLVSYDIQNSKRRPYRV
jgi:protein-tyrosine phosphatase